MQDSNTVITSLFSKAPFHPKDDLLWPQQGLKEKSVTKGTSPAGKCSMGPDSGILYRRNACPPGRARPPTILPPLRRKGQRYEKSGRRIFSTAGHKTFLSTLQRAQCIGKANDPLPSLPPGSKENKGSLRGQLSSLSPGPQHKF